MIEWLTDTLVYTGALMALVLAVRRPVSRWFGAGAAYALWALPMIRLVLPPLALPRGLLPHLTVGVQSLTASAADVPSVETMHTVTGGAALPSAVPLAHAAPPVTDAPGLLSQVPWMSVALTVWLTGALLFLAWRFVTYRWMRRDLLADARLVARSGAVRIVETRAITAPLAFGVFDKVIALPWNFLAEADSETSDFVITHEMEHHNGSDLLALIVMQPLFALHWFNPLGWAAWRAVRADQESFCDARVMAGRTRAERASYGQLIASMAGGTRLGLAAPMAGPLSGAKPIVQRLKALSAHDITPARRVLGRSLFALAIVAVPATATISYAAMDDAGGVQVRPTAPAVPAPRAYRAVPQDEAPMADVPDVSDASDPVESDGRAPPMDSSYSAAPVAPLPPMPPLAPLTTVPPMPPVPPVAPTAAALRASAERAAYGARMAARAQARTPQVQDTTSADGTLRTIRIVQREGGSVTARTMVLDSRCPADRSPPPRNANTRVICTGEPEAAKHAALDALGAARNSIAANTALDAHIKAQTLAELDSEIADARREAAGS
ncbi:M56 family metallopeptidase [Novosphingobium sp. Leaf2]|uniref:M56 family metallopeptidase n=1 Tax=Novosphingobium sp. Leaf2 TaxID=1735670 RepID=UPI0006FA62D0|nr:M56 family metallopeptidase [Novosphingobium sp. Leaf2]KQM18851.1 antirepressor regulating drug resistance protein [Novosphingobium sp. Leaf2]